MSNGGFVTEPLNPAPMSPAFNPAPRPQAPAETPVLPQPMPKKKSHTLLKWLIIVAVGLFVVSIASFWFSSPSFSDRDVQVSLEGPQQAEGGQETTYTLKWTNGTKLPLNNFSIRFFYPADSIVLKDGQVTKPDSDGITVDQIQPGQSGQQEFKMFLVGDKGSIKTPRVTIIYKAGTLKSEFKKELTASTAITSLPVTLTLSVPPNASAGQTITYQLDARNESDGDLNDLKIEFTYPDGFTPQSFIPDPNQGKTVWNIDVLRRNQGKRISVTGTLSGKEGDTKTVAVVLKRRLNDQYVDFVRSEWSTVISSPILGVSLKVNDQPEYVAIPGDQLQYSVTWRNNSQFDLIGVSVAVKLEGEMFDLSTVDVRDGFFDSSTNSVIFTSSGIPGLADVTPGNAGTAQFNVHLRAGVSGAGGSGNSFVKATARVSTPNVPTGVDANEVVAVALLTTKIGSQPTLAALVYYSDAQYGSSGPFPPVVGQETVFTVHWQLTNPGNTVSGAVVRMTLPPGVVFKQVKQNTGGQTPTFDRNTNVLSWNVGSLPFGTGMGMPKYETAFQVSITPSGNQVGQAVTVMGESRLDGTDSFTNQPVISVVRVISSSGTVDRPDDGQVQ